MASTPWRTGWFSFDNRVSGSVREEAVIRCACGAGFGGDDARPRYETHLAWCPSGREAEHGKAPYLIINFIGREPEGQAQRDMLTANVTRWREAGGRCDLNVQHDLCITSHVGLATMRNFAIMRSLSYGADFVLLLEDDVEFTGEGDILTMASRSKDITVPYLAQPGSPERISGPQMCFCQEGQQTWWDRVRFTDGYNQVTDAWEEPLLVQGELLRLHWAVFSCVLFRASVFQRIGERPFVETLATNEDEYNCLWWERNGVELWQDLGVTAKLLRPPTPLRTAGRLAHG